MNEHEQNQGRGADGTFEERSAPTDERHETLDHDRPRVYVASLADYNAGHLHGTWLDAARDVEDIESDVRGMLAASLEPIAEEWAIHDYEGFGELRLSEYESFETVSRVAIGIVEHGKAFAAWAAHVGIADVEALARFGDAYLGEWESLEDYAEQLLEDVGANSFMEHVPESLQPYVSIDVAGFARDLALGGDVWTADSANGVYVFEGRA